MDLVGRARRAPDGASRRGRGGGDRGARPDAGTSARSRASCCKDGTDVDRRTSCASSSRGQRRRAGSCPSAGRSSTRCRRRASASSTRRCCAPATPTASSSSRSSRDSRCALAAMTADARRVGLRAARRRPLAARSRVRVRAGRRRASSAACSASGARSPRRVALGNLRVGSSASVVSLLIAADTQHRVRRLRAQPVPVLAVRRDGGGGVDRVPRPAGHHRPRADRARSRCPHPLRSIRRRGPAGARATPRSRASRCATASGPSLGLGRARRGVRGRRRSTDGPAPPARARGVRRDVREARADRCRRAPISCHPDASRSSRCSRTTCAPRRSRRRRRAARGGARRAARRRVRELRLAAAGRGLDRPGVPGAAARRLAGRREGAAARASSESVAVDLSVLEELGQVVETRTSWGAEYHVMDLVDEFGSRLREELDFRIEARNARAIGVQPSDRVAHLRARGLRGPEHVARARDGVARRRRACARSRGATRGSPTARSSPTCCSRTFLEQMLQDGVFHADPHPGNVMLLADGRLALIDFGAAGRLDPVAAGGAARPHGRREPPRRRRGRAGGAAGRQPAPWGRRRRLRARAGAVHGATPGAGLAARRRDVQRDAAPVLRLRHHAARRVEHLLPRADRARGDAHDDRARTTR